MVFPLLSSSVMEANSRVSDLNFNSILHTKLSLITS